jgi:hypothetical protein
MFNPHQTYTVEEVTRVMGDSVSLTIHGTKFNLRSLVPPVTITAGELDRHHRQLLVVTTGNPAVRGHLVFSWLG